MNTDGASQGMGNGQPRPPMPSVNMAQFVRPDHVRNIPNLSEEKKTQFANALSQMWAQYEASKDDPDSQQYKAAIASLQSASQKLRQAVAQNRGMQRPLNQQAQGQQGGVQQAQQPQNAQQNMQQNQANQRANIPPPVLQRINAMTWTAPDGLQPGSPEALQRINQLKQTFATHATQQMRAQDMLQKLRPVLQQFQQKQQAIPPDIQRQYQAAQKQYTDSVAVVKRITEEQENLKKGVPAGGQQAQAAPGQSAPTPQQNMQMRQDSPPQSAQNAAATPINPSLAAAQNTNRPAQSPVTGQAPTPQQPQGAFQQQQQQQSGQPASATQPQNAQSFQAGARPPMNMQMPGQQGAPNNANGAQPGVNTLSQALQNSQAARAGSFSGATPQSANPAAAGAQPQSAYPSQNPSRPEGQMSSLPKMPIAKTINPTPPTPVQMAQSRPTMAGPGNGVGAPGVMGQPVIQKPPGFQLEGDDGRVLNKKKLDELVRQVTGADGGGALSGEVEEVSYIHPVSKFILLTPSGHAASRGRLCR